MAAPTTVRLATEADARAVAEVHVGGWQWAYRGQLPDAFLDDLAVEPREAWWRDFVLGGGQGRLWVVERDGRLVGFAATGPSRDHDADPRTAELLAIYVVREVAGTGVGRALLERAVGDLRDRGYAEATLWVLDTNARARRFYEAAGWRLDDVTRVDRVRGVELREVRYRIPL